MELGTIIKTARKKANLSQEQSADALGVSRQTRVPIQQVFDDLYDGKFQMLRNGELQYIK